MYCKTVGEALIINVGDKELYSWDLEELQKKCAIRCCNSEGHLLV